LKYIGMIVSKIKTDDAIKRIKERKHPGARIDSVYAPIGLNIGKTTTQEIAIAITAEMLAIYNNIDDIHSLSKK
ncbi:MAG: XdhC family protein, partial [Candidatus Cloacimonetes bacterium]|jgi:xanthine dehydrogenase accessory factor|nr:XdhC family protein [Candidatus Cloacimonadota bacterium]